MDMRIPPLRMKIMLESNPLKSIMSVRRLAAIQSLDAGSRSPVPSPDLRRPPRGAGGEPRALLPQNTGGDTRRRRSPRCSPEIRPLLDAKCDAKWGVVLSVLRPPSPRVASVLLFSGSLFSKDS